MSVWPAGLAGREGLETARNGRWTSLLVVVAVAWVCAGPGAADATAVSTLVRNEQAWVDAGAYVFFASGASQGGASNPVPAGACDRLARVDGIRAAFAIEVDQQPVVLLNAPGGRVSLVHVTPGATAFLGVSDDPAGVVLVTEALARRTGIVEGDSVRVAQVTGPRSLGEGSGVLRARVVSATLLGDDLEGTLLVPGVAHAKAQRCVVSTDAAHLGGARSLAASVLSWEGTPASIAGRLFEGEFVVDYATAYEDRTLRFAWVAGSVVLGLLWFIVQWFRRSHTAIYATFGAGRAARLVMQGAEWGVLMSFGLLWGWSLGIVGALALGADPVRAFTQVTGHAMLTVLGASVLVVLAGLRPTGTLLDELKDR